MAHLCKICSEPCYCMGDFNEELTGQPAYCKHCTDVPSPSVDDENYTWDGFAITEFDEE